MAAPSVGDRGEKNPYFETVGIPKTEVIGVAARLGWGGAGAVVSGLAAAAAVACWVRIADL